MGIPNVQKGGDVARSAAAGGICQFRNVSVVRLQLPESVYEGDRIVEIQAGAATFDVSAPATGRLSVQLALPRDILQPGQVLGFVVADSHDSA